MRVGNNVKVYAGENPQQTSQSQQADRAEDRNKSRNMTFFAGNLRGDLSLRDRIAQKREQAKKQAFGMIEEVWNTDRAIDEDLDERRQRIGELRQSVREEQDKLDEIAGQRGKLKDIYGVKDGDREEQELALLRKQGAKEALTEEEENEIAQIQSRGLTEYQKRQLELDEPENQYRTNIDKMQREIRMENAVIRGTKLERLKHHAMTDAQKQADEIMDAAADSIIQMVMDDAKEHLDEEQEKREEEAETIREEREERQEFIEKQKEKREEKEEYIEEVPVEEMLDLSRDRENVQREVENIMNKMGLIAEDIKGAMVDSSV